jgi:hypothetical protein
MIYKLQHERKEYQLTKEQYDRLLNASQAVPYMIFGGREPRTPQENANRVWKTLGDEIGFHWQTVLPSDKGKMFFTAETKQNKE